MTAGVKVSQSGEVSTGSVCVAVHCARRDVNWDSLPSLHGTQPLGIGITLKGKQATEKFCCPPSLLVSLSITFVSLFTVSFSTVIS